MLIILIAATTVVSLVVETLLRRFSNTYEVVWPIAPIESENSMALEIVAVMRKTALNLNGK